MPLRKFSARDMNPKTNTIVLIHGLWMTPRCWECFIGWYEACGYQVLAPAWPRMQGEVEAIRTDSSALAGLGLREIADHYERIIRSLPEPPVLIGHSMGGLIVQILLDRGLGAAGISIDGTVPRGVLHLPFSVIKASNPVLSHPSSYSRCVTLTFEQFHFAFANTMTPVEARRAYDRYFVPGPARPIFQAALANFNPWAATAVNRHNDNRAPLLLINGAEDNLVPPVLNQINQWLYMDSKAVTAYKEFPDRSHLIIAQQGWKDVAEYTLSWAEGQLSDEPSLSAVGWELATA